MVYIFYFALFALFCFYTFYFVLFALFPSFKLPKIKSSTESCLAYWCGGWGPLFSPLLLYFLLCTFFFAFILSTLHPFSAFILSTFHLFFGFYTFYFAPFLLLYFLFCTFCTLFLLLNCLAYWCGGWELLLTSCTNYRIFFVVCTI